MVVHNGLAIKYILYPPKCKGSNSPSNYNSIYIRTHPRAISYIIPTNKRKQIPSGDISYIPTNYATYTHWSYTEAVHTCPPGMECMTVWTTICSPWRALMLLRLRRARSTRRIRSTPDPLRNVRPTDTHTHAHARTHTHTHTQERDPLIAWESWIFKLVVEYRAVPLARVL